MGGEALCPVKVLYPTIEECKRQEAGVGGLVSRGKGFSEGKLGKGITFEMQIKKISNKKVIKRKNSKGKK